MAANNIVTISEKNDFQRLFKQGCRRRPENWLAINFVSNDKNHLRWGFTIPRYVGTAVVRNRLRRWCKEIIRRDVNQQEVGMDLNVFFRKRKGTDFYKLMRFADVNLALQKFFENDLSKIR